MGMAHGPQAVPGTAAWNRHHSPAVPQFLHLWHGPGLCMVLVVPSPASPGAWGWSRLVPQPHAGVLDLLSTSPPQQDWRAHRMTITPGHLQLSQTGSVPSGFNTSGSALATTRFSAGKTSSQFTLQCQETGPCKGKRQTLVPPSLSHTPAPEFGHEDARNEHH